VARGADVEAVLQNEARRRAAESRETSRRQIKRQLSRAIAKLGSVAVLPGEEEERGRIDELIRDLEALAPIRRPLGGGAAGEGKYDWGTSREYESVSRRPAGPREELEGVWRLVYASNGTYATRSAPAQAVYALSLLPLGFGVKEIQQRLKVDRERGTVRTVNVAVLSLGPLGEWKLGVRGAWEPRGDGVVASVRFDRATVRPVSILGCAVDGFETQREMMWGKGGSPPPRGGEALVSPRPQASGMALPGNLALPQLEVPLPSEGPGGAEWQTTFLGADFRVGRGRSQNVFLFERIRGLEAGDVF